MSFLIGLITLLFGMGSIGSKTTTNNTTYQINACYFLEEEEKFTVPKNVLTDPSCIDRFGGKTFIRIRKNIKIINGKTDEARGDTGTCVDSESLRNIGTLPDGKLIYWVPRNYQNGDTSQTLLVLLKKDENFHTFDVYIDESLKDNIPDFIKECKETGGLVPVIEDNPNLFPPQSLSLTDIQFNQVVRQNLDTSNFQNNFDKYKNEYINKFYVWQMEIEKPTAAEQIGTLIKGNNQESRKYDVFYHVGSVYLKGYAESKTWIYDPTTDRPPTSSQERRSTSLQMKALHFIYVSDWTWSTPNCKPAVYLYPKIPTVVSVKLNLEGNISTSIPKYSNDGWLVTAYPDGTIKPLFTQELISTKQTYPYLFYDANMHNVKLPKTGWIIEKNKLNMFFSEILTKIGLNNKEQQDFLSYWLPKLSGGNKWYIGLLSPEELNRIESLEINPHPDNLIRVRFYFEKLDDKHVLDDSSTILNINDLSNLSNNFNRDKFTVVDWGGIIENGTCGVSEVSN